MSNIEDHIQKAQQEGKFDNLPGKGKPLNLDDNPFIDPDWRVAHHMLQSSGFTLPWIATRQEIEQALENARHELKRSWDWRQKALTSGQPGGAIEADWRRAVDRFQDQISQINRQIFRYNLEVPADQFQRLPVNLAREIDAITRGTSA